MGIYRKTFLIDEEGIIKYIFEKISPSVHAGEVLGKLIGNT